MEPIWESHMYDIHMGPIYIMALLFWQVLHHWLDCVTDCA